MLLQQRRSLRDNCREQSPAESSFYVKDGVFTGLVNYFRIIPDLRDYSAISQYIRRDGLGLLK